MMKPVVWVVLTVATLLSTVQSVTYVITENSNSASTFQYSYGSYALSTLSLSDDSSSVLTLPFTFPYYDDVFSSVRVYSNGVIGFVGAHNAASGSVSTSGQDLSSTTASNEVYDILAFLWTDLNPNSGGTIYYGSITVNSQSAFVVVLDNVNQYGSTSCTTTIEILLYANGNIEIVYVDNEIGNAWGCTSGNAVSIGMKGPDVGSSTGLQYAQVYGPSVTGIIATGRIYMTVTTPPTASPTGFGDYVTTQTTYTGSYFYGNYNGLSSVYISDDSSARLTLPFSFPFYEATFSDIRLYSNGVIGFVGAHNTDADPNSVSTSGQDLSSTTSSNEVYDILAFLWTDLNPSAGGTIYHGSCSGGDITSFAIVFSDVPYFSNALCKTTIEIILYSNGNIEVMYIDNNIGATSGCLTGGSVSIGIKGPYEGTSGHKYTQVYGPASSGILATGSIVYNYPTQDPPPFPIAGTLTCTSSTNNASDDDDGASLAIGITISVVVSLCVCGLIVYCCIYLCKSPPQGDNKSASPVVTGVQQPISIVPPQQNVINNNPSGGYGVQTTMGGAGMDTSTSGNSHYGVQMAGMDTSTGGGSQYNVQMAGMDTSTGGGSHYQAQMTAPLPPPAYNTSYDSSLSKASASAPPPPPQTLSQLPIYEGHLVSEGGSAPYAYSSSAPPMAMAVASSAPPAMDNRPPPPAYY